MFGQSKTTTYEYYDYISSEEGNRTYGELKSIQYPGMNIKQVYSYDALRRVEDVNLKDGETQTNLISYTYSTDIYERLLSMKYGNQVVTDYTYDDTYGRVKTIDTKSGGDTIFHHEYKYDILGNRDELQWQIADNPLRTTRYEYDSSYQLTKVSYDDDSIFMYKYDNNGNRTFFKGPYNDVTYAYDKYDRIVSTQEGNLFTYYTHDDRGNIIKKEATMFNNTEKTTQYEVDMKNQLRKLIINNETKAIYDYDESGQRIRQRKVLYQKSYFEPLYVREGDLEDITEFMDELYWYGGGSEVLIDTDASENIKETYLMAGNQKIAKIDKNGEINYFHTDVLGSIVATTDDEGKLVEANTYGPFGNLEFSEKQDSTNRYMYTGQETDSWDGLQYYGARWYDSELGRFISEDPAAFKQIYILS